MCFLKCHQAHFCSVLTPPQGHFADLSNTRKQICLPHATVCETGAVMVQTNHITETIFV